MIRIIQAITSVRVGDGASVGSMDLPLARERHTRWPFVPGSAVKGALRSRAHFLGATDGAIAAVFGPEHDASEDDDSGGVVGTLAVQGATLLALPVRSLRGTFALLTCPTALARLGRSLGADVPELPTPSTVEDAHVAPASADRMAHRDLRDALAGDVCGLVWLEDLDLVGRTDARVQVWAALLEAHMGGDVAPLEHLVVVHDDVFLHATRAWTEHRTRNAIDDEGVVQDHMLFTVEMLPAETLWWTAVSGDDGGLLPGVGETWILGGHQSVGLGRVCWFGGAE